MDLAATTLPPEWVGASLLVAAFVLGWAAYAAPWGRFASSEAVHVWYGTIFALVVLWSIRAVLSTVVVIHLLGTAGFALAAGAPLALIGGAMVVLIAALVHGTPLANVAAVFLQNVMLPVGMALALLRISQRVLPANFFVYAFAAGFLAPALAFATAGLTGAAVIAATGGAETAMIVDDYVPYLLYLAFAEGTLTGMLITLGVVYRPQWIATFDDRRYLHGK